MANTCTLGFFHTCNIIPLPPSAHYMYSVPHEKTMQSNTVDTVDTYLHHLVRFLLHAECKKETHTSKDVQYSMNTNLKNTTAFSFFLQPPFYTVADDCNLYHHKQYNCRITSQKTSQKFCVPVMFCSLWYTVDCYDIETRPYCYFIRVAKKKPAASASHHVLHNFSWLLC